jgi:hypothetical protein
MTPTSLATSMGVVGLAMTDKTPLEAFTDSYLKYVSGLCEDGDCYPQPAMTEDPEGGLTMLALDLPARDVMRHLGGHARDPKVVRLAFGVDRYAKEGQGTTMSSVFTYAVVERGGTPAYGFIEYDGEGEQRQHDLVPTDFWYARTAKHFARVMRHIAGPTSMNESQDINNFTAPTEG